MKLKDIVLNKQVSAEENKMILDEDFKKKWNDLREETEEKEVKENEFPKLLANAGHYTVELDEDDKVTLYKRNHALTRMPLTIWQTLCRQF